MAKRMDSDVFHKTLSCASSSIVGGYKSAVTKHANRLELEMGWQTRFHDHVIRDEPSFVRIAQYIKNNPHNWKNDRFFDG